MRRDARNVRAQAVRAPSPRARARWNHQRLVPGRKFEQVAGERPDLLLREPDELAATRREPREHPLAIALRHAIRADCSESAPDAHHDIRVIERHAFTVARIEDLRGIAHCFTPLREHPLVRARRAAGVRDAPDVIEHEAAGSLEIPALALVCGQIEGAHDAIAGGRGNLVEDFAAPLRPAVRSLHRIQYNGAVRVPAHPVVRENRVGLHRLGRVIDYASVDALAAQRSHHGVELLERVLAGLRR